MLWQTIRAYFLPSAHPGLQPVRGARGGEFRPKRDEYGNRVEARERDNIWESYKADRRRQHNRALVRPFMGVYMRRWGTLGLLLLASSELFHWAGMPLLSWPLFFGSFLAFLMVLLLLLLTQEIRQ